VDQDATWYEGGPCDIVLDGNPASPTERGTTVHKNKSKKENSRTDVSLF